MRRWLNLPTVLIPLTLCAALVALAACKAPDGAGRSSQTANANSGNAAGQTQKPAGADAGQARASASPADGVRRITVADANREAQAGRAVFVDVRSKSEFERGHIKGAISLPRTEIGTRHNELPRDKTLITYCA